MADEEKKPKVDDEFIVSSCSKAKQRIPTQETWMLLRRAYCEAMRDEAWNQWNPEDWKEEGMKVPNEIRMGPVRGRGVFVTENIEKGTRVYVQEQAAIFENQEQLVTFLEALPWEYQCDVLLWAYPVEGKASVDLDAGSFVNHSEDAEEINLSTDGYATRDIREGEIILMNYSKFIFYNSVPWFDEIRSAAWDPQQQDGEVHVYESTDSYNKLGAPGSAVEEPIKNAPEEYTSSKPQDECLVNEPRSFAGPVFLAAGCFLAGAFCSILVLQNYFSFARRKNRRKMQEVRSPTRKTRNT